MVDTRNWTTYNTAQSEEKRRFVALLADLCRTVAQPPQTGIWDKKQREEECS